MLNSSYHVQNCLDKWPMVKYKNHYMLTVFVFHHPSFVQTILMRVTSSIYANCFNFGYISHIIDGEQFGLVLSSSHNPNDLVWFFQIFSQFQLTFKPLEELWHRTNMDQLSWHLLLHQLPTGFNVFLRKVIILTFNMLLATLNRSAHNMFRFHNL